jgi:SecD/SecF fusion protein
MSPVIIFFYGFALLIVFGWYLFTDSDRIKRNLGTLLTAALLFLCIHAAYPPKDKIHLGLDLKGGTSFLISLVSEPVEVTNAQGVKTTEVRKITKEMVDQAVEVIRKRVDALGTSEPVITPSGDDRILVQIPGLDPLRVAETREQLQKVAKLEFRKVHAQSSAILAGSAPPDPAYTALTHVEIGGEPPKPGEPERKIIVRKKVDLEGKHLVRAGVSFEAKGWLVHINFDDEGKKIFGDLTTEVYKDHSALAIILDGKVISAPGVNDGPILGGSCEISGGNIDEKGARNLASALENPLQTPVKILEERSASASLGAEAVSSGVKSGLYGIGLTIVCVLLYYRFSGVVAIIALAVNMVVLFGAMAMFGTVLTLPGIAGIILTLGMAVDANVLIYERLREELADGKELRPAIFTAFEKAFTAIFDSNFTTLITAAILFWKASGPVKGFAVALTMGIIATLFTALIVTRNLFDWSLKAGILQHVKMANLIRATKFNFLGWRRTAIAVSLSIIGLSIAIVAWKGEKNLGVDFKGGDRTVFSFSGSRPTDDEIRIALKTLNIGEVGEQTERSANKEFITVRSASDTSPQIVDQLQKTFPAAGFTADQRDHVGGLVGAELLRNSIIALGLGMIGILIFVTIRFEFSFALGALVALLHDVIITAGFFSLIGREFSMVIVGAILTVAGYSVNDTIVVFDRIREGIKSGRKGSVMEIMNASINETLSRTILTGGVTLLTTFALFVFGGPDLADFALVILIGVLVGTYSSVFVASPIVLWWSRRGGQDLRKEIQKAEQAEAAV